MATDPAMVVVPRKRRGAELFLLLFALVLVLGAYAQVDLNVNGELSERFTVLAIASAVGVLLAHIAVRWRIPYADPVLLPCVVLLNGLGIAMIHRIDLINDPPLDGARTQLIWTALGVILFILVATVLRDHRPLQGYTYTLGLVGLVLLLLPLVPGLGTEKFGAQIWIQIGPYSFQPAEAAKVVLAIAFASYLVEKRDVLALAGWRVLGLDLPRARVLGPILLVWAFSLLILVSQRDLGTSLLFFGTFVMMLYVATERPGWVVLGTGLFAAGGYAAYLLFDHVKIRVGAWLDPFGDYDRYYQVINAQFGMAWGGLLGRGLGRAGRDYPAGPVRLHRRGDRGGARGDGTDGGDLDLQPDRVPRVADGAAVPRPVRQAAGRRPGLRAGAAGVHDHRRSHPAAPAHRPDHTVHVPGRLLADLQLDHHRAADGDLAPRPPADRDRAGDRPRPGDDPADGEARVSTSRRDSVSTLEGTA